MAALFGTAGAAATRMLAAAPHPVLFLDVDGTLAPLVERPEDARVPVRTQRLLQRLRSLGATVVFVSGRAARDAKRVTGYEFDGILGNHGAELLRRGRLVAWAPLRAAALRSAERGIRKLLDQRWPEIRLEHKGHSIALHHRLPADQVPELLRMVRKVLHADLAALPGRRVIDVRARSADKGVAVLRWLKMMEAGKLPLSSVLYAGDDTTDEDAFRALGKQAMTIAVGTRPQYARFRTSSPASFVRWLARLAKVRSSPTSGSDGE